MREFSIKGRLHVENCNSHQDMILRLFKLFKDNNIRFIGETKEINKQK
jgi:hypothetical protein